MAAIGRNDPCPCGSGRKYKKCCLAAGATAGFTLADRAAAYQRLLAPMHPDNMEEAADTLWGRHCSLREQWDDPVMLDMAECVLQAWICFDELDEGGTLAEEALAEKAGLGAGERRYLEMGRRTMMRLYEVVDVQPGASITLRDLLDGREVRVQERSGSRSVHAWDLVAARVFEKGASGLPEIDGGMLPIAQRLRDPLVKQLREMREELDDDDFKEALPILFFDAWMGPGLPPMVNFDGEAQLMTTVHFEVVDEARLIDALDHAAELEGDEGTRRWTWIGTGTKQEKPVTRAFLFLEEGRLSAATNSRERGEKIKVLIEQAAGSAVRFQVTEYEDLEQAVRSAVGKKQGTPPALPEEMREPARAAELAMLTEHYEAWVDEPVPMLDGKTPRVAAAIEELRPRVAELIEGLEGLYERALAEGHGAYDPTWMWEDLGLVDLARGRSRTRAVVMLPHEVIAELEPELLEVAADIGERARRASHDDVARTVDRQEIRADLGFHRLVRGSVQEAKEDGIAVELATAEGQRLAAWTGILANLELHLRKIFWVDEALSWMLGATGLDVQGEALRPPFASFALVFTDRYALGLAERLLAEDPSARLRGRILSVLTVYVTASAADEDRTELRLAFAAHAHDGGWPDLVVRDLEVRSDAGIAEILRTLAPGHAEGDALATIAASPPLRDLVGLTFNAILYATSADAETVAGDPRGKDAPPPRRRRNGQTPPTGGVFRLPGKIEITSLRELKRIRRGVTDVQLTRRCMVRGHWRRAGKNWKDERPRWIRPYWRGPGSAPVVEREYRLR